MTLQAKPKERTVAVPILDLTLDNCRTCLGRGYIRRITAQKMEAYPCHGPRCVVASARKIEAQEQGLRVQVTTDSLEAARADILTLSDDKKEPKMPAIGKRKKAHKVNGQRARDKHKRRTKRYFKRGDRWQARKNLTNNTANSTQC